MSQVADYDVANAAGSVVRAELNLILDAIKTLNAGTQNNLGTTSPYQIFADTTNNKLKNLHPLVIEEIIKETNPAKIQKIFSDMMDEGYVVKATSSNNLTSDLFTDLCATTSKTTPKLIINPFNNDTSSVITLYCFKYSFKLSFTSWGVFTK